MGKFISLQGIIEIYCVSRKLVRDIARHYNVDCYKEDDEIFVNFKEFHKVYTTKYNPVLFTLEENKDEKKEIIKPTIENTINRTFFSIFSTPVNYHQKKLKKLAIAYVR